MNPIVEAKSVFHVPIEVAFDTFADPQQMSKFWFHRRDAGLKEGESIQFFMGPGDDAPAFPVSVKEVRPPTRLTIEWGDGDDAAVVTWNLSARDDTSTLVHIKETGHRKEGNALIARLLDSTGGFNQVIIAAKALAEHGVAMNVVADHA